jgi:hypothetical protein
MKVSGQGGFILAGHINKETTEEKKRCFTYKFILN